MVSAFTGLRLEKIRWLSGIGAVLVLLVASLFIYRNILFTLAGPTHYPWGSDTMGHIFKAEYLLQNYTEGILYPDLLPAWYLGVQMLRYYPPLPYYLLAGLASLSVDSAAAASWYVSLCALMGGLAWLPFRRWFGWLPALSGGLLFLFLPDNLRVSLAEGNLPRALATAVFPLLIFFLLRSIENDSTARHQVALALCYSVVVLSHPMMAAIYAICSLLLLAILWLLGKTKRGAVMLSAASLMIGLLLQGWWLLPSLTEGITSLDSAAMTEALAVFSIQDYFTPTLRAGNPEIIYPGAALLALSIAALLVPNGRKGYPLAFTLVGWFGVLITTHGFNGLFNTLPLHNLLWPLRFLGAASFFLLLALLWTMRAVAARWPILAGAAALALLVDQSGSLALIHLRPAHPDLVEIQAHLSDTNGWREATLDNSRLGSTPSYLFSQDAIREQVFGWAYQGARTARTVAALNEAVEFSSASYVIDRLNLYGVDDVVLLNDFANASELRSLLELVGYRPTYQGATAALYHREGRPRAFVAAWPALGVGRGAQNLAYLFPQLIVGGSPYIDDYSLPQLLRYDTLVLSGFSWRNKAQAEALVKQAAAQGLNVVVDLTGAPEDPEARIPHFLGVWGERIILAAEPALLSGENRSYRVEPFVEKQNPWYTHTPQGDLQPIVTFDYLGETATVVGYRPQGDGALWFLGLNVPYHAVLNRDPEAVRLLAELLRLQAHAPNPYISVTLEAYSANHAGYRFDYELEESATLFLPIAHFGGMHMEIDGVPTVITALEDLIVFDAPAGRHTVELSLANTAIYRWGRLTSLLAIFGLAALSVSGRHFKARSLAAGIVLILLLTAPARPVLASGLIILDGNFDDWGDHPDSMLNIPDPIGDASSPDTDLVRFYFATNPNEETAYFMAERASDGAPPVTFQLYIDTDNDGAYDGPNDRTVKVTYKTKKDKEDKKSSQVDVTLYDGSGRLLKTIAANADWGASELELGNKVEWGVAFEDLGIVPNQTISIYIVSVEGNDRAPDSGDITWSPANALGVPLLALLVAVGIGLLFYRHRRTS